MPEDEKEPTPPAPPRRPSVGDRLWVAGMAGLLVPGGMASGGVLLACVLRGDWLPERLAGPQPWPAVLLWALLGMGLSLGTTMGLAEVWPRFGRALERSGMRAGDEVLEAMGLPVMALVVAAAGFGEEMLFRGGLQPSVGLFLAALAFGMAHGAWSPRELWAYVLAAWMAGLCFGGVYLFSGFLWSPIIAHAGHNLAVTFYLVYRRRSKR